MRIVRVGYRKNKSSKENQYEHEHYECHVEVNEGESEWAAMQLAKDFVEEQFDDDPKAKIIRDLRKQIKTLKEANAVPAPLPHGWCQYCGYASKGIKSRVIKMIYGDICGTYRVCEQCEVENAICAPPQWVKASRK